MLFACAAALALTARPIQNSGLVYRDGCAFFLDAPAGWTLDNKQGKVDGLPVVLYEHGSNWRDAQTAMYARSALREKQDLAAFIKGDCADFLKRDPKIVVTPLPPLKTKDRRLAVVRQFDSEVGKLHDEVAYVALPKTIALIVLTSRTAQGRKQHASKFKELVASFAYFTDKVEIDKKGSTQ